jgi:hypothetical protein
MGAAAATGGVAVATSDSSKPPPKNSVCAADQLPRKKTPGMSALVTTAPNDRLPAGLAKRDPCMTKEILCREKDFKGKPFVTDRVRPNGLPAKDGYEDDHIISLTLGGWDGHDGRNLWFEKQPQAKEVDKIEARLHREMCKGEITLKQAQDKIIDTKMREG